MAVARDIRDEERGGKAIILTVGKLHIFHLKIFECLLNATILVNISLMESTSTFRMVINE